MYMRFILSLSILFFVSLAPSYAKEQTYPITIAPDLIVESFEFGEFPDGNKTVVNGSETFIPKRTVRGDFIGYRIKLKTKRTSVRFHHQLMNAIEGIDGNEKINNRTILVKWIVTKNFPRGERWVKVWIEGKQLPLLRYKVI